MEPGTDAQVGAAVPNMLTVSNLRHLVWTQAGFKKACRCLGPDNDRLPIEGYPTKYPCVVTFSECYRGYHYWLATCTPLRTEIEWARAYLELLVNTDEQHKAVMKDAT